MNLKILFLDFDGVLNSSAYFRSISERGDGLNVESFSTKQLDPAAIARLNQVVAATGCQIVVSSSWRLMYKTPRTSLSELLTKVGFVGQIVGTTPNLPAEENRCVEIATWMAMRERAGDRIRSFAIVDDNYDAGIGFAPQFVCTSFATGLDDDARDQLIRILGPVEAAAGAAKTEASKC